ncbi:MAG: DinB family protein [Bacteroidia bacterium]|nr:DinB family protein [Bacteroidia bacterium]
MQLTASELENLIHQYMPALLTIPEREMVYKPNPSKWSKKEILGHIVDSAQNNIRRFIIAQYEENPAIKYNQDQWLSITGYQQYVLSDLINLWYLLNKHIVVILKNMPDEMKQRKCQTEDSHSLEWLARDYIKHLKHHVHQVLDLEPVAYP